MQQPKERSLILLETFFSEPMFQVKLIWHKDCKFDNPFSIENF
jgi:hypothetical protein